MAGMSNSPLCHIKLTTLQNFFMDIPRSWGKLEDQHSPQQQASIAKSAGTDIRFKAGGIIAASGLFVILWSLQHSMHHYKQHRPGVWPAVSNYLTNCPPKLLLTVIVLAIRLAYGVYMPWHWDTSIFKYDASPELYYGAGYAPSLLIIIIFNIFGFIDENEDKVIIKQRRIRGQAADSELGIVKRPHWWRKNNAYSDEQRLRNLASEVGGGRPTAERLSSNVELMNIRRTSTLTTTPTIGLRQRSRERARDDPFRDHSPASSAEEGLMRPNLQHRPSSLASNTTDASNGTRMTGVTLTESQNRPAQQIRSMLDI
jgi:hypothetical protein